MYDSTSIQESLLNTGRMRRLKKINKIFTNRRYSRLITVSFLAQHQLIGLCQNNVLNQIRGFVSS